MAATGTPTPNIGLRIPIGTDPASVDDINYNSNLLDTKLGAVGSTSVQAQLDAIPDTLPVIKRLTKTLANTGYITLTSTDVPTTNFMITPYYAGSGANHTDFIYTLAGSRTVYVFDASNGAAAPSGTVVSFLVMYLP